MALLLEYRDAVKAAGSLNEVQSLTANLFHSFGFEQISYFVLRPPYGRQPPPVLSTYPVEWKLRYLDLDYVQEDAMFHAATMHLFPLRWDEIYSDQKTSKKQRLVFDEAREFGVTGGLTIPIHGPAGGVASLNISGKMRAKELDQVYRHLFDELTLIAAHAHQTILALNQREESYEPIQLTDRERECLLWTSQGKSASEIGQILSVSQNTILFHLNNAMRKLHVFSKHHAVVKAIMLGFILPRM